MTTAPLPRVHITAVGPVSCATVLWRYRGELRVTAVAKAAFAFVQGGAMRIVEPPPIHDGEVHHRNNPARSVAATSDLAPYVPRVDVILVGHAHAPHGAPAPIVTAQMMLGREGALLTRVAHVVGDRGGDGAAPTPFQRMPLVYERAFGGPGHLENPLGVGAGSDRRQPNLVDPARPEALAGFGPISRAWPARKSRITPEQRRALDLPVPEIGDGFDWSYFQAAPPEQRLDQLHGDEWIVLDGMHPSLPRVSTRLPGARAEARVHGLGRPGYAGTRPLALAADTLYIDADAERCTVTWRGSFALPGEDALRGLRIAAGVALPDAPVAWPEDLSRLPSAAVASAAAGEAARPADGGSPELITMTLDLDDEAVEIIEPAGATPGAGGSLDRTQVLEDAPPEATPPAWVHAEPPPSARTVVLDLPAAPPPPRERTQNLRVTADLLEAARAEPLPFTPVAAPAHAAAATPPAAIPGAPWSRDAAAPAPRARIDLGSTMDLGDLPDLEEPAPVPAPVPVVVPVAAPVPAPVPAPVAAPAPAAASVPAAAPWSPAEPPEPPPPPAPQKPEPAPRPHIKDSLYKRFGKR